MVQVFCTNCRVKVEIQNPRQVKLHSGSEEEMQDPEYEPPVTGAAIVGMCPTCKINLFSKIGDTAE
jgi:hypothetical protein